MLLLQVSVSKNTEKLEWQGRQQHEGENKKKPVLTDRFFFYFFFLHLQAMLIIVEN